VHGQNRLQRLILTGFTQNDLEDLVNRYRLDNKQSRIIQGKGVAGDLVGTAGLLNESIGLHMKLI
jgi:hypothetical protein